MDNPQRLLILDDDASVAMTLAAIAEGAGFSVRTCGVAAEFFTAVAQWQPSHLAIDLIMPEVDGAEVMRQLAERGCVAQIIITSGMGSDALKAAQQLATERGLSIAGILPKPFRAQQLRALLRGDTSGGGAER